MTSGVASRDGRLLGSGVWLLREVTSRRIAWRCSTSFNKIGVKVKVKVKLKLKFTLEQGTKDQRGSRGIALLFFFNLGARWGGWSTPLPGRFTPGKDPVPIV